jgi:hypothetical protein
MHSTVPGVHMPWHVPETHAWLTQGAAVPHCPAALHVSTPLPEHCVEPGVQTPTHIPATHAWFAQEPQLPVRLPQPSIWMPQVPIG